LTKYIHIGFIAPSTSGISSLSSQDVAKTVVETVQDFLTGRNLDLQIAHDDNGADGSGVAILKVGLPTQEEHEDKRFCLELLWTVCSELEEFRPHFHQEVPEKFFEEISDANII
jgi:hypothetical protein